MMRKSMVLVMIMLLVSLCLAGNAFSAISAAERQALIDLYDSTGGDSWTDNTGWKTAPLDTDGFAMPGTEGGWYGVTLGGAVGAEYVVELDLSNNNLVGNIPASIDNLSNLTRIFFGINQISGSIPAELGNLSNLTGLSLRDNQLTGNIPSELGNLSNLVNLYLYNNQLTGNVPAELGNILSFNDLLLGGNQLTGSIPSELGNLINLTQLSFSRNQMTGSIPSELGNLSNLTDLGLDYNSLYTTDTDLITFLETKNSGWETTQTIAPSNFAADTPIDTEVPLTWTAISYTADTGGYEVCYSTTTGGPYTSCAPRTANKSETGTTVIGLTPATTYYFAVRTITDSHTNNQNTVTSEFSAEISATTAAAPTPPADISGKVTNESGQPLAGVTVFASNPASGQCGRAITAADGTYTIPNLEAGSYKVVTSTDSTGVYVPEYYNNVYNFNSAASVTMNGTDVPNVNFFLVANKNIFDTDQASISVYVPIVADGEITGTVIDNATSLPVENVRVVAGSYPYYSALTQADGTYTITNLPEGSYTVSVDTCGTEYAADSISPVELTAANKQITGVDFTLDAGGEISGTVTDTGTNVIEGANVNVNINGIWCNTTTDANGNYTLKGLQTGAYNIYVSHKDYLSESIDSINISAGATTSQDFSLTLGGKITGTVIKDSDKQPIQGMRVIAYDATTNFWMGSSYTYANGIYIISGLPAGSYKLKCDTMGTNYVSEFYDNTTEASATPVSVTAGETTADINFSLYAPPVAPNTKYVDVISNGDIAANPDQSVTLTFTVKNLQNVQNTFDLQLITSQCWKATFSPTVVTLPGYGQATVTVTVTVPDTATPGTTDTISLTAVRRDILYYTITPSSQGCCTISPSQQVTVQQGYSETFTITPQAGCIIESVLVDGQNMGSITSYTFSNVSYNHTISAVCSIANQAPVISNCPNPINKKIAGEEYSFSPAASDGNSADILTYSIENKPDWLNFDTNTGKLEGKPENENVGPYENITISVSDGTESYACSPFSFTIEPLLSDDDQTDKIYDDDVEEPMSINLEPINYPVTYIITPPAHGEIVDAEGNSIASDTDGFIRTDSNIIKYIPEDNYIYYEDEDPPKEPVKISYYVSYSFNDEPIDSNSVDIIFQFHNELPELVIQENPDTSGKEIVLDGSNSSDEENNDSLEYQWMRNDETGIQIEESDDNMGRLTLTAPAGMSFEMPGNFDETAPDEREKEISYTLTVTDIDGGKTEEPRTVKIYDNTQPAKPEAAEPLAENEGEEIIESLTDSEIILSGNPFSDTTDGDAFGKSFWQLRRFDRPYYSLENYPLEADGVNDISLTIDDQENGIIPGLKYFWQVSYEDIRGRRSDYSSQSVFVVGDTGTTEPMIFPAGTGPAHWHMVSVTHWPKYPDAKFIFFDGNSIEFDPVIHELATYDPQTGQYQLVSANSSFVIEPGKSYWLATRQEMQISFEGVPVAREVAVDVELQYSEGGWNMIAPPNSADYNWDDVQVVVYNEDAEGNIISEEPGTIGQLKINNNESVISFGTSTGLWSWTDDGENGHYEEVSTLEKNKGYWVKVNKKGVFLRFPAPETVLARKTESGKQWHWLTENLPSVRSAHADSASEQPPLPPGVESSSAAGEGGGGGCFIQNAAGK